MMSLCPRWFPLLAILLINSTVVRAAPHSSSPSSRLHVVIDPGHGGRDRGATRGSLHEADITLQVSQILATRLRRDGRFRVTLTRTADVFLSLSDRTRLAEKMNGDVFVSIHVNSSPDSRARGVEFYFQNQLPPDEESMYLAARENQEENGHSHDEGWSKLFPDGQQFSADVSTILQDLLSHQRIFLSSQLSKSMVENWHQPRVQRSRPIRQAPFYVVSHVAMPSSLVEIGFLSNSQEVKNLVQPSHHHKIAANLFRGLVEFKEIMDKAPRPSLH